MLEHFGSNLTDIPLNEYGFSDPKVTAAMAASSKPGSPVTRRQSGKAPNRLARRFDLKLQE
jgi:hypothetical protein